MTHHPPETTSNQGCYPSTYLNFVVRCWLRSDGRVSGYFVEAPSGVRYPFSDVLSLADGLWRRILARWRPEGPETTSGP